MESPLTSTLSQENLDIILNLKHDRTRKVVVVIGNKILLEKTIKTIKELSMITFENKWIIVFTDSQKTTELDDDIKSIISMSNMLLLKNNFKQNCSALNTDCIEGFLTDLIGQALMNVLNDTSYDFKGPHPVALQTKNHLLSELRVSMSLLEIMILFQSKKKKNLLNKNSICWQVQTSHRLHAEIVTIMRSVVYINTAQMILSMFKMMLSKSIIQI